MALAAAIQVLLSATLLPIPPGARAEPVHIDGIVAQVGDELVLASEVEEQVAILSLQANLPDSSLAEAREEVLRRIIDEKIIVQEARARGIIVADDEVEQAVDRHVELIRQQMGGDEGFRQELAREGLTEDELVDRYRGEARRDLLYTRLIQREIYSRIEVSDAEVEQYYQEHKNEFPPKPGKVDLAHVFVGIRPDEKEVERAQAKLDLIHRRLDAGEAFGAVARELSDDPAARQESGSGGPPGDLGWFEPGDLDPRFETVVSPLSPGEISEPFQVPQGVEILRLIERDGDRIHLQHIRVSLAITEEAARAARKRADKVHELAREGADFVALVDEYSDDRESAERGGHIGSFADGELNPEIDNAIRDLQPGGVSEVVATDQGFHIFKVVAREGGGQYEYEEIAERLRARIGDERAAEKTEEWLAGVRGDYFIRLADRERQPAAGVVPATGGRIHVDVGGADREKEKREEAEPAGAQNEE